MEDKNVAKISLSTLFLILSIIVIIIMGIFIYKLNNDKAAESQKSQELQSQVTSLKGTVSDLQGKINSISNTINGNSISSNSNTVKEKETFSNGTYKHGNTKVTFKDNKFNLYLDENFSLDGLYEIKDNQTIVCNITDYTFNAPDGARKHDISQNEKWIISFNIKDEKTLEVKDINLPDQETEIIISIHNLIGKENKFLLQ